MINLLFSIESSYNCLYFKTIIKKYTVGFKFAPKEAVMDDVIG